MTTPSPTPILPAERDAIVRHLALYAIPVHGLACKLRHPAGDVFRATTERPVLVRASPGSAPIGEPCAEFYVILGAGGVAHYPADWYDRAAATEDAVQLVLREHLGGVRCIEAEVDEEHRRASEGATVVDRLAVAARGAHRFVYRAMLRGSRRWAHAWFELGIR